MLHLTSADNVRQRNQFLIALRSPSQRQRCNALQSSSGEGARHSPGVFLRLCASIAANTGTNSMKNIVPTDLKVALVYCRVSTKEQTQNLSLPTQEARCVALCNRSGWPVEKIFRDEG